MLGIRNIASYIPDTRVLNIARKEQFGIDEDFIRNKIGVESVSVKSASEETSDLCIRAFQNLLQKTDLDAGLIDVIVVVTQNPDANIPHTSAIVHGKLGLKEQCACFDVSLGCSGYVYGLSVIQSFMREHGFQQGLLFTADPYSKIIDQNDKNTSLLFGDAATVTLITDTPVFTTGKFSFGTLGKDFKELACTADGKLYMNGRAVFNFTVKYVPDDILLVTRKNGLRIEDIDRFVLHQGSKYIIDTITRKLELDKSKVEFDMYGYGNTVSSSIPIILEKGMTRKADRNILICGFGVGLSWASTILTRVEA